MKKTIATITLAFLMTFGTTFAKADGIIIGDSNSGTNCADVKKDGIIIGDLFEWIGIIIGDKASQQCTADTEGIIIGD